MVGEGKHPRPCGLRAETIDGGGGGSLHQVLGDGQNRGAQGLTLPGGFLVCVAEVGERMVGTPVIV